MGFARLFSRRKTPTDESRNPKIWLSDLLAAFTDAALRATESVQSQNLEAMEALYDKSPGLDDETLTPKTVKLGITPFVLPPEDTQPSIEVPLAALVQPNPLVVDEMTFDFECSVLDLGGNRLENAPSAGQTLQTPLPSLQAKQIEVSLGQAGAKMGMPMRVSIRVKAGEPPAAHARIEQALLRGVE